MNDIATMIIEVGLSKTLNQLKTKAHAWLTAFDNKVRIATILHATSLHVPLQLKVCNGLLLSSGLSQYSFHNTINQSYIN